MFPSRPLFGAKKLVVLSAKRGNKNFYKGRGAPSLGFRGTRGKFTFDPAKFTRVSFIAPDLTGFPLKAYVAPPPPPSKKPVQPAKGDSTTQKAPKVNLARSKKASST